MVTTSIFSIGIYTYLSNFLSFSPFFSLVLIFVSLSICACECLSCSSFFVPSCFLFLLLLLFSLLLLSFSTKLGFVFSLSFTHTHHADRNTDTMTVFRKIVKGEQANLRLLEKQEVELEKVKILYFILYVSSIWTCHQNLIFSHEKLLQNLSVSLQTKI